MVSPVDLDAHRLPDEDDEAIAALTPLQGLAASDAVPVLRAWMASARTGQRQRVLGYLLCHMARFQGILGETARAEALAAEALGLFHALDARAGQAMAINTQALLTLSRGDYAMALEHLTQALPLARESADAMILVGVLNTLGSTLYDIDDPAGAAAAYDECVVLMPQDAGVLRRDGARSNLSLALARWAEQDRERGLPASDWMPRALRAAALAREVHDAQTSTNSPLYVASLEPLSLALLLGGDAEQALALLDTGPARQAEAASPYFAVHVSQIRARALLALGRAGESVSECERALVLARAAGSEVGVDALYMSLSMAHEAAGDFAAALQAHRSFHAIRARLVFDRTSHLARAAVSQLDLERALRESRMDALTGLVNRRAFDERLAALLSTASTDAPLTLMLIDIDHFKAVNDTRGHPAGDALLRQVAALLRGLCRGSEPPARLGGDEFAVLVRGHQDEALVLAERVRASMTAGAVPPAADATISIGLAEVQAPCAPEELLARADRALYEVKRRGRNGVATAP
jgi:diguanylate cyclase (GGDEF)-like protein